MKPIKLEIEGLHSFAQKQIIDFNTLTSRGVFGIFGATGSGKSTILDAIILALYGKVYRSKSNSDFINLKSKQASVSFEFSFVDEGKEKHLLVTRTFKRKPKNANEVEQRAEVYEVGAFGSRQVVEGAKKVDDYIVNLIGMSDAEFLKCIALPQGEFASFLKSKPNERVSIIGNIFDLNKYGQELWEKVKYRLENIEKEKAVLEGQIFVVGSVSQEQIDKSKKEVSDYENEVKEIETRLQSLTKTEREEREVARLNQELDEVKSVLKKCEDLQKTMVVKKDTLKKAKKYNSNKFVFGRTEELSSLIMNEGDEIYKKTEILRSQKQRLDNFLVEKEKESANIKIKKEESISKVERLKGLLDVEKRLLENKKFAQESSQDLLISGNKIESLSKNITETKVSKGLLLSEIAEVDLEIEKLRDELKHLESVLAFKELSAFIEELKNYREYLEVKYQESLTLMTSAIDSQGKLAETKKAIIDGLSTLHSEFGFSGAQDELKMHLAVEDAYKSLVKFEELKARTKATTRNRLEIATLIAKEENKKQKHEDDKIRLDKKLNNLSDEIGEIRSKISQLESRKEILLSTNGVGQLMDTIKIGDNCPICKNEVLEKGIIDVIDTVVLDNEMIELKTVLERKESQKENIIYAIAKVVTNIEICNERIEELTKEEDLLKSQTLKMFNLDENSTILDEEDELQKLESCYQDKLNKAKKALKKEKTLYNKLRDVSESIIKQNCIGATARMEVESLGELLNSVSESIKEKDIKLLTLLSENENIQERISRLEKVNNDLEKKLSSKEKMVKKLAEFDVLLSKLETELAIEKKVNVDLKNKILDLEKACKIDQIAIDSETISGDIQKTINLEKKELESYEFRENELKNLEQEQQKEINLKQVELESLISRNKAHKDEHKILAENVLTLLTDLGVSNIQDSKLYRMEESEIQLLEDSITNFDKDYSFSRSRKDELERHLNGRVSSFVILEQILMQIDQLNIELSDKKEKLIQLKHIALELEEKQKMFTEYSTKLLKIETEYNVARELYELLKGKALLEFIAEEFINDISFMASNKLQVMMDGRYVLKYENKDFVVIDNFNDAIERSVSTLSGGEMFVVSLALALSISDAISSKSNKSIDFFFLDEGFGTLDKEYCEYIVESLIKLESQNLTIGLISHIPELQEKIIQKLEVVKTENGTKVRLLTDI